MALPIVCHQRLLTAKLVGRYIAKHIHCVNVANDSYKPVQYRVEQKGSKKMKATRINMEQHTVSVKMDRHELAEVMSALAYLSWYYRDKQLGNLADKAWKMREDVDRAFDKLYSDVD